MPQISTHKSNRIREPRVHLTYEIPTLIGRKELPFVIGVIADFSGGTTIVASRPSLHQRTFQTIDLCNFDTILKKISPRITFSVKNALGGEGSLDIDLTFRAMDDFLPERIADRVEALRSRMEELARLRSVAVCGHEPNSWTAKEQIANLDLGLSRQLNLILHHPIFQRLEATWRALSDLALRVDGPRCIQIRIFDATKAELGSIIVRHHDADRGKSSLFDQICSRPFTDLHGEPFSLFVGDYYFDHSPGDIDLLEGMATISAKAQTLFVAGANPRLLGVNGWAELETVRSLKQVAEGPDYAAWRAFRGSLDSAHVCLTAPRILGRSPYGNEPETEHFRFLEGDLASPADGLLWSNSAFALAAIIARSFVEYGWFARVQGEENGGCVEGVATAVLPNSAGDLEYTVGPAEISISMPRENEMAGCGLVVLCNFVNTDKAIFPSIRSIHKPALVGAPTESVRNGQQLQSTPSYLLAAFRFMHYLRCIFRDCFSPPYRRDEVEKYLNSWLSEYAIGFVDPPGGDGSARYPVADAGVELSEVPDRFGQFQMRLSISPRHQLYSGAVTLSLTTYLA